MNATVTLVSSGDCGSVKLLIAQDQGGVVQYVQKSPGDEIFDGTTLTLGALAFCSRL